MNTPVQFDPAFLNDALRDVRRRAKRAITNQFPPNLRAGENAWLNTQLKAYSYNLRALSKLSKRGRPTAEPITDFFAQYSTKVILAVRAQYKKWPRPQEHRPRSIDRLRQLATSLTTDDPCVPSLRIYTDQSGRSRVLNSYNVRDYARQLCISDIIRCVGPSPHQDFGCVGGGGRAAQIAHLEALVNSGARYFLAADIKSAFSSVRPNHVADLMDLPKWALDNILFPPEDVMTMTTLDNNYAANALRGLPHGSVCSSAALSMVCGNALRPLAGDVRDVSIYVDNVYATAHSRSALEQFRVRLEEELHCGGHEGLRLHQVSIVDLDRGQDLSALGYRMSCREGMVRVNLTEAAFARAEERCLERLAHQFDRALTWDDEAEVLDVAEAYFLKWAASNSRWMKDDKSRRAFVAGSRAAELVEAFMSRNTNSPPPDLSFGSELSRQR
jgi:hypothetical protein